MCTTGAFLLCRTVPAAAAGSKQAPRLPHKGPCLSACLSTFPVGVPLPAPNAVNPQFLALPAPICAAVWTVAVALAVVCAPLPVRHPPHAAPPSPTPPSQAQYYSLDITFFKSSTDAHLLDLLWNKYWVSTLSANPLLANRDFAVGQVRAWPAHACAGLRGLRATRP